MEIKSAESLASIIQELHGLDEKAVVDGVSHHFLEFRVSKDKKDFLINGNSAGLIYFAKAILSVANQEQYGSHIHLDESGIVDQCDMPVIVCLKLSST
jgi:hypothetical protein